MSAAGASAERPYGKQTDGAPGRMYPATGAPPSEETSLLRTMHTPQVSINSDASSSPSPASSGDDGDDHSAGTRDLCAAPLIGSDGGESGTALRSVGSVGSGMTGATAILGLEYAHYHLDHHSDNSGNQKRGHIGAVFATTMSIANIAPTSSIFFVLPVVMADAGADSVISCIFSGLFCLCLALTVAEYAKYVHSNGSFHAYVTYGLGPKWGLMTAWLMLFAYVILGVQALLQFSGWMSDIVLRWTGVDVPWPVIVVAMGCVVILLSYFGIEQSLKVQLILFCIELAIVVALCLALIVKGGPFVPTFSNADNPNGASGFIQSLIFGIMLFNGFESATSLGEDAKNPAKVVSRAVVASIFFVQFLIAFGTYAFTAAVGPANAVNLIQRTSPADYYARHFVGDWFAALVDFAGCTATFNLVVAQHSFNFRLLASMGQADMFGLRYFGHFSGKRRIPLRSILWSEVFFVVASVAMGVLCAGSGLSRHASQTLTDTRGCWDGFNLTAFIGAISLLLVYMSPNASLYFFIRRKAPQDFRRFRHLYLPIANLIFGFCYIGAQFYPLPPLLDFILLIIFFAFVIGGGVYVFLSKPNRALTKMMNLQ